MLVPYDNYLPSKSATGLAGGWTMAAAVVLLMAGLVYFSNGRSTHAKSYQYAAHSISQSQPQK
jgi:hypothetical protein